MEVKVKFNDINVKEEKEKTLVKILMLKGEKGDTVSAEWGTITGNVTDQTDLKNALDNKANNSDIPTNTSDLNNDSGFITNSVNNLTNYYTKIDTDNKLKKKIYYFDTVALMKLSNDLENGDMVITKGYYSENDGGGAEYIVSNSESLTEYQEELNNDLYATLITKDSIFTSMLRSSFNDDVKLLNYVLSGKYKTVYIDNDLVINATILPASNITIINLKSITANKSRIFNFSNKENVNLIGGKYATIDADASSANSYQPILISNCKNINILNCEFNTQTSDGLYIGIGYSETVFNIRTQNIKVENCKFINCARNGIVVNSGDNILINNCYFENINTYSPGHGIDVEYEYRDTSNELYTKNFTVSNCYAKNCNTLINVYPTEKMANNSSININNCTCDNVKMIFHGPINNISTNSMTITVDNILFKNMTTYHNIRIAEFRNPNYLSLNNIIIDNFIGEVPSNLAEFGDIFIDGGNYEINNILVDNHVYIGNSTRGRTFVFKDAFNTNIKVYNTKIESSLSGANFIPFGVKFINCSNTINSNIAGQNSWFKVMELPDYCKKDFYIYSTSWLHIILETGDTNSITVTRSANSYISKARIINQNNKKYLELFTSRVYSFPFIYDIEMIKNGVDKRTSDATSEMVLVETDVTLQ